MKNIFLAISTTNKILEYHAYGKEDSKEYEEGHEKVLEKYKKKKKGNPNLGQKRDDEKGRNKVVPKEKISSFHVTSVQNITMPIKFH